MSRRPRRSKSEIYSIYQQSLKLKAEGKNLTKIGELLDISPSTLSSWRISPPTLTKADKLLGSIINGWVIGKQVGYDKVQATCVKCGTSSSKHLSTIETNTTRCHHCFPTNKDLYLDDVKDLWQLGLGATEISEHLKTNKVVVGSLLRVIREDAGTEINYEYTFKEIATTLGISYAQALKAYNSALKKLSVNKDLLDALHEYHEYTVEL